MLKLKQAVIVEGRYDKSKLSSLIDATIITTGGFDIFRDKEKLAFIRMLAARDGVILLTDSDAAGFRIRSYLSGAILPEQITHVYIPDLAGKERRKAQPSAEGKLGVEGVPAEALLEAFRKAGVAVELQAEPPREPITMADLMECGLTGGVGSAELRRSLLQKLGLPARLGTNGMLRILNSLYGRAAFLQLLDTLE